MQLHAEAVLDLFERPGRELQFRAVAGDFPLLQGKFLLSEPDPEVRAPDQAVNQCECVTSLWCSYIAMTVLRLTAHGS